MNISIAGLGKLGAPWAAVLASKGHRVIGVDVNEKVLQTINSGHAPVFETGLDQLIHEHRANLRATADMREAVLNSDVTFIVVATPSDREGSFSLRFLEKVIEQIGAALAEKQAYHLVVITSTVMPGDVGGRICPLLEKVSGKRCGDEFGMCYNPEFIALGSVIRDMLRPDFLLIGESDKRAGDMLESIHRGVCENNPPVKRMNFVNAELTKIAINTFITTKISYANMVARVCERLPGADADVVTGAVGMDSRIGTKYLKGAVSYGGPCFPRDNLAFVALASHLGTRAGLAEATDRWNQDQIIWLAETVRANLPAGGRVGILGLSYKPTTDVAEAPAGLLLARYLVGKQVAVTVYDPAAMNNARRDLGESVAYADSMAACARDADVLVITTAWAEFRSLAPAHLKPAPARPTIIDCWRVLDREQFKPVATVVVAGMGPAAASR